MNALSRHKNGKPTGNAENPNRLSRMQGGRTLLPALIALGGGTLLAAGPAAALQLGELRVQSHLGQPLRASIAYALNPSEHLQSHCIRLGSGHAASGLPAIGNARISIVENVIHIAGRAPVNEPLVALTLNVDCPGTAKLIRDYTAFVDPAAADAPAETPSAARAAPAPRATVARAPAVSRNAATPRAPVEPAEPVAAGTYRVRPGDSLSGIAARISGRAMGLWDTVDALFAANPGAFIDGNRDLLLAGSELVIPAAVLEPGSGAVVSARAAEPTPPAVTASPRQATPAPATQPAPTAPEADAASPAGQPARPVTAASTAAATAGTSTAAEARQGDVSLEADGPFVSPIEPEAVTTPATSADRAGAAPERPAESRPAFNPRPGSAGSRTWLMWLGGSGAALILALVLFGRQLKQRFGSAATSLYGSAKSEGEDTTVVARVDPDAASPDVGMEDDGELGDSGEIDLAQEFGYTMSGQLSGRSEDPFGSTAILESEILPGDDTGEYDLSMIVDATQQELPDAEDTTKDLRAIQLDEDEDEGGSQDEYTLEEEVDYKILEQDYEDELTATQALNAELARAATEMSLEIEADDATSVLPQEAGGDDTDDATTALPADMDNASAPTVEMPRTGKESAATEPPADDREDTRADEDLSSTMGDAQNDPTAETDETKKLRAS